MTKQDKGIVEIKDLLKGLDSKVTRQGARLERVEEKVDQIGETLSMTNTRVQRLEDDMTEVKALVSDIPVIKAVVTSQSRDIKTHDNLIAGLKRKTV